MERCSRSFNPDRVEAAMSGQKKCTVGRYLGDECNKLLYCRKVGLKKIEEYSSDERELIWWRSGLSMINIGSDICLHHEHIIFKRFQMQQSRCHDPFNVHTKAIKGGLREVSLQYAKNILVNGLLIVPGCKLCPSCQRKVSQYEHIPSDVSTSSDDVSLSKEVVPEVSFVSEREVVNLTLLELDISPIKLHSVPQSSKVSHGKRKIRQANKALSKRVASYLDVDAYALDISNENPRSPPDPVQGL